MKQFFRTLAGLCDLQVPIEQQAHEALLGADPPDRANGDPVPLSAAFKDILCAPDALPVAALILETPLPWSTPGVSDDPGYAALGQTKVHVDCIGPQGICRSDTLRVGLYGILPGVEYGLRTHPAEEVFIMIAGEALWQRGDAPYVKARPSERSHHPSMLPHATKTEDRAFMSLYVWAGDISTENFTYHGGAGPLEPKPSTA